MNKKILIPLTAGILVSGCIHTDTKKTEKNIADTLSQVNEQSKNSSMHIIYATNTLNPEQQQHIEKTITSYMDSFHIKIAELIVSEDTSLDDPNTLAYTKSGIIYLVPKNLMNIDMTKLDNIIIHELFHAIKSKNAVALPRHMLVDGFTITGIHGLSILVQKGEVQTQFGCIEDAAAEALAAKYSSTYQVPNVYYANIGSLMLKIIGKGRLTKDDIILMQQTNDLISVVGKILNKQANINDIEIVMMLFNDAYNTDQDITNETISKIESIRKNN